MATSPPHPPTSPRRPPGAVLPIPPVPTPDPVAKSVPADRGLVPAVLPPHPVPAASQPSLSARAELNLIERFFDNLLDLSPKAAVFWVLTQTGVNSLLLSAAVRVLLVRKLTQLGASQMQTQAAAPLLYLIYFALQRLNPGKLGAFRLDAVRKASVFKYISAYYPHRTIVENGRANLIYSPLLREGRRKGKRDIPFMLGCHPHVAGRREPGTLCTSLGEVLLGGIFAGGIFFAGDLLTT